MLNVLLNIFIIVISVFFLIGFHEWGHCLVAQKLGIPVERFAIGFGKILFSWHAKNGTDYAFCLFPLGGYVKFKDQETFDRAPIYKRALVIFAGPFFNLVFAFLAYWFVFTVGITHAVPKTESGKEIVAVDDHPTQTWAAVIFRLIPHIGKTDNIIITYHNSSEIISAKKLTLPDILGSVGITPAKNPPLKLRHYSPLNALSVALKEVAFYFELNIIVFTKLITGIIPLQALVGPIGLFAGTVYAAHQGMVIFAAFLGFLSVGLAFANLLPIPGLDGAYLVYLGIEAIRKKPLSFRVQMLLFRLGMILLFVIMFQTVINDLGRLL